MSSELKFETLCLHAGQEPDPTTLARAVPVHRTSSYVFRNAEHASNLFALNEPGNIYTRIMNPTQEVLERRVAALENGAGALAGSSGTSAVYYSIINICAAGDEIVPYPNPGISKAREYSRDLWINNKWDKAIHPLSWLLEKFSPVPDWDEIPKVNVIHEDKSWGVVYTTDNQLDQEIMDKCQRQLKRCVGQHRIVSVSLKPINFGDNICLPLERGYLSLFKQMLAGFEELKTDYVFVADHDVLYHPTHFQFVPPRDDIYYYNTNVWKVRMSDGHGLHVDDCKQGNALCANREPLVEHFRKRVKLVEENGFSRKMGLEPGTHNRPERVDDYKAEAWNSEWPIIDLRHNGNLTSSRWTKEEFRIRNIQKAGQRKIISRDVTSAGSPAMRSHSACGLSSMFIARSTIFGAPACVGSTVISFPPVPRLGPEDNLSAMLTPIA